MSPSASSPRNTYYDGLNLKLLAAIPRGARRVLELGCANGRLGRRFKELNPGAQWWGVDLSPEATAAAAPHLDRVFALDLDRADLSVLEGGFDAVVIGDLLEHLRDPQALLQTLCGLTTPEAVVVCCLPNMAHLSVIERLVAGDISYDSAGLLDSTHTRFFSPASALKTFLDGGWLPDLCDQYRVDAPQTAFAHHVLAAAAALGVPAATALHNLGLYQMILVCPKRPPPRAQPGTAMPFSVIVPVDRPLQFELNIARSPGLQEIGADIVGVQGAAHAAAAYASGAARARHPWRLLASQDMYFPAGSGFAIAEGLAALQAAGLAGAPVGFAGVEAASAGAPRAAGCLVDGTRLFRHGAAAQAVSIDDCAVALHAESVLEIDPALGWHLWATDLCLQAQALAGQPIGQILDVPLFHNLPGGDVLPDAFHTSLRLLQRKHPGLPAIPTRRGMFARRQPTAHLS
jgi:2-polyprenyl-3-methyl-5-hydroxy-6-metoxy-1,4-benzoquinol methylase